MIITLASCSLNQWALDFTGNLSRIQESIRLAKDAGAAYRLGPELEVPGYGCNDHFLEADTVEHSWEVLAALLSDPSNSGVVCDVGMPVVFRGILYNCRVIFLDGRILLIRPKMFLANDGNYREMRWFTPWAEPRKVESLRLPEMVRAVSGQDSAPFGDAVVSFADDAPPSPLSPHVKMSLDGVEVFTNGSASHHEFRKLNRRVKLICGATEKCGGVYMYANQKGCDGERVYYDGCPLIVVNGEVVAQGAQFSLDEVEVITATVDLQDVWAYRAGLVSRALQASTNHDHFPLITVDARLGVPSLPAGRTLSKPRAPKFHTPAEEIRLGPACWLWDYLRRTKAGGYFLPLSGGIDSCASALIVYSMCELVHKNLAKPGARVKSDLETVVGKPIDASSMTPASICNSILHTCYMGTVNSSAETRARATTLAESIGSYHLSISIDTGVDALLTIFRLATLRTPQFRVHGAYVLTVLISRRIKARLRMVIAYLFAQLLPWTRNNRGSLLVLGSANIDEMLRGYLTKYDCSSADVNPLGGISKVDLTDFVRHMRDSVPHLSILSDFLEALPSAELEPITASHQQTDEADMGMTYRDLSIFGTLRKVYKMGPLSMFRRLLVDWSGLMSPTEIAAKVKRMFFFYSINRHKSTVLPPAYHMSSYSADDNRFDLRPFLYNASWSWQFKKIDENVPDSQPPAL
ncbi:glutamine-dependent NAD(+) synthetase [Polyrhizophydium stewartii]|uniref:Glutamine-dependent NAD(+) synthetase n=1 Tax=Polyrhizophydium stewartii TaxID=2732419 RepID=A0ABR4NDA9_9FUNG